LSDPIVDQFGEGDLVKLKVANVNEISGGLKIAFSQKKIMLRSLIM
jgi:hypothetical protein